MASSTTYRNMGITCTPLWVRSGEDGVNQDEGADDLSAEGGSGVVSVGDGVSATT